MLSTAPGRQHSRLCERVSVFLSHPSHVLKVWPPWAVPCRPLPIFYSIHLDWKHVSHRSSRTCSIFWAWSLACSRQERAMDPVDADAPENQGLRSSLNWYLTQIPHENESDRQALCPRLEPGGTWADLLVTFPWVRRQAKDAILTAWEATEQEPKSGGGKRLFSAWGFLIMVEL